MTQTKAIEITIKGMQEQKQFLVPSEWDDRKIVSNMVKAYDNFANTEAGARIVAKENDKAAEVCYYAEPSEIDVETNPYATNPDWYILLMHTPVDFLQELGIQPVTLGLASDVHIVELTEEEVNMPLDSDRLSIVKTIGNYHIVKKFVVGTPDDCDLCDEAFYQRWYFNLEFGELEEEGFMGYELWVIDGSLPYEYPDSENLLITVEEAEAFIASVQK
ncbi:hypothetical protein JMA_43960 (plasmid) [Jeotgalibacillus malaysiensis]|uniref:Uncharacterized protein n=1 Tax=Jeotgalibacillus malaysiensis TaxID=1508404 RepID=A0A0B5AYX2_9BACL|nr:hypothetical protein [Jeotgalibacillus malaysiensis]AJD93713.1 hypothetical protein JMA_43960 [Jeotgalibacillus malaysiensis]